MESVTFAQLITKKIYEKYQFDKLFGILNAKKKKKGGVGDLKLISCDEIRNSGYPWEGAFCWEEMRESAKGMEMFYILIWGLNAGCPLPYTDDLCTSLYEVVPQFKK